MFSMCLHVFLKTLTLGNTTTDLIIHWFCLNVELSSSGTSVLITKKRNTTSKSLDICGFLPQCCFQYREWNVLKDTYTVGNILSLKLFKHYKSLWKYKFWPRKGTGYPQVPLSTSQRMLGVSIQSCYVKILSKFNVGVYQQM